MRLYGHIGYADQLPGPALCGKPNRKRHERPALFYCGKCVDVVVTKSNRSNQPVWTWVKTRSGGAA